MANFVINQTASEIQQILNKADTPDTIPTPNSQNLVESGGVKTYVDTKVAAGASITTESFAGSALEDSTDGLTATDTAISTSKAVKDYVDTRFDAPELASGFTELATYIPTTTATVSGFIICEARSANNTAAAIDVTVAGVQFTARSFSSYNLGSTANLTVPIAIGESYSVHISQGAFKKIRFKAFT